MAKLAVNLMIGLMAHDSNKAYTLRSSSNELDATGADTRQDSTSAKAGTCGASSPPAQSTTTGRCAPSTTACSASRSLRDGGTHPTRTGPSAKVHQAGENGLRGAAGHAAEVPRRLVHNTYPDGEPKFRHAVQNLGVGAKTGAQVRAGASAQRLDWLLVEEVTQLNMALWADVRSAIPAAPGHLGRHVDQLMLDLAGGWRHELTENKRSDARIFDLVRSLRVGEPDEMPLQEALQTARRLFPRKLGVPDTTLTISHAQRMAINADANRRAPADAHLVEEVATHARVAGPEAHRGLWRSLGLGLGLGCGLDHGHGPLGRAVASFCLALIMLVGLVGQTFMLSTNLSDPSSSAPSSSEAEVAAVALLDCGLRLPRAVSRGAATPATSLPRHPRPSQWSRLRLPLALPAALHRHDGLSCLPGAARRARRGQRQRWRRKRDDLRACTDKQLQLRTPTKFPLQRTTSQTAADALRSGAGVGLHPAKLPMPFKHFCLPGAAWDAMLRHSARETPIHLITDEQAYTASSNRSLKPTTRPELGEEDCGPKNQSSSLLTLFPVSLQRCPPLIDELVCAGSGRGSAGPVRSDHVPLIPPPVPRSISLKPAQGKLCPLGARGRGVKSRRDVAHLFRKKTAQPRG